MVARGDLGVEVPFEELPALQRRMVRSCAIAGKPVIVATHLLESMVQSPMPTRAEVTDVANAVYEQVDAVMLSGETAAGAHPTRCVEVLDRIARRVEAEPALDFYLERPEPTGHRDHLARTACRLADSIGASAIVCITRRGLFGQLVASYRPKRAIVYAFTNMTTRGGSSCSAARWFPSACTSPINPRRPSRRPSPRSVSSGWSRWGSTSSWCRTSRRPAESSSRASRCARPAEPGPPAESGNSHRPGYSSGPARGPRARRTEKGMMTLKTGLHSAPTLVLVAGCQKEEAAPAAPAPAPVAPAPAPREPLEALPAASALNMEKVLLGRSLFFDTRLSGDARSAAPPATPSITAAPSPGPSRRASGDSSGPSTRPRSSTPASTSSSSGRARRDPRGAVRRPRGQSHRDGGHLEQVIETLKGVPTTRSASPPSIPTASRRRTSPTPSPSTSAPSSRPPASIASSRVIRAPSPMPRRRATPSSRKRAAPPATTAWASAETATRRWASFATTSPRGARRLPRPTTAAST